MKIVVSVIYTPESVYISDSAFATMKVAKGRVAQYIERPNYKNCVTTGSVYLDVYRRGNYFQVNKKYLKVIINEGIFV